MPWQPWWSACRLTWRRRPPQWRAWAAPAPRCCRLCRPWPACPTASRACSRRCRRHWPSALLSPEVGGGGCFGVAGCAGCGMGRVCPPHAHACVLPLLQSADMATQTSPQLGAADLPGDDSQAVAQVPSSVLQAFAQRRPSSAAHHHQPTIPPRPAAAPTPRGLLGAAVAAPAPAAKPTTCAAPAVPPPPKRLQRAAAQKGGVAVAAQAAYESDVAPASTGVGGMRGLGCREHQKARSVQLHPSHMQARPRLRPSPVPPRSGGGQPSPPLSRRRHKRRHPRATASSASRCGRCSRWRCGGRRPAPPSRRGWVSRCQFTRCSMRRRTWRRC